MGFALIILNLALISGSPAMADLADFLLLETRILDLPDRRAVRSLELFQESEIWLFHDLRTAESVIRSSVPPSERAGLLARVVSFADLSLQEQTRVKRNYPVDLLGDRKFMVWNPATGSPIPPRLRSEFYAFTETNNANQSLTPRKIFTSKREVAGFRKKMRATSDLEKLIWAQLVEVDSHLELPLDRKIGDALPIAVRNVIIQAERRESIVNRVTFDAKLKINAQSIPEIARAYSGHLDPGQLESYLRERLARSGTESLTIPFTDVLPEFVRDRHGKFEFFAGANCFNATLCSEIGTDFRVGYTSPEEFVRRMGSHFEAVQAGSTPRPEDVYLYWHRDTDGQLHPFHAARYMGEGTDARSGRKISVIFTKDGYLPDNPFVLAEEGRINAIYGQEARRHGYQDGLVLTIHRKRSPGTQPSGNPQVIIYRDTTLGGPSWSMGLLPCPTSFKRIGMTLDPLDYSR